MEVEYIDAKGEKRPCYQLNKQGIMQMLNKESAYVRYKTQQYIKNIDKEIESLKNVGIQQNEIFRYANIKLKKAEEIIGGK